MGLVFNERVDFFGQVITDSKFHEKNAAFPLFAFYATYISEQRCIIIVAYV